MKKYKKKVLHVPLSKISDYSSSANSNIIYDDNVKLKAENIKVFSIISAYNKKVRVFNSNNNKLWSGSIFLYQVNKKFYTYIRIIKESIPNIYIYIYTLFMIFFILLICITYSNINDSYYYISEYNNLINDITESSVSTVDSINLYKNKISINSYLNIINKSIPDTYDVYKSNFPVNYGAKSLFIQYNQPDIGNKYNESIILNKVKDLHIYEMIIECDNYKDKISQLEMQINDYNIANSNLLKDIKDIIKEFKSEHKKS